MQNAIVLWAMHPWERDARLIKEALTKGSHSYNVITEVACTRSSEELLGARRAYHSLFDHSVEEDVASHVNGPERKVDRTPEQLQPANRAKLASPFPVSSHRVFMVLDLGSSWWH